MIVILIIAAAAAIYFLSSSGSTTTTSTSSTGSTSTTSTTTPSGSTSTTSSASTPGPKNSSQLVELNNEPTSSIDPAAGFFAGEDEIMTNVYQTLLMFNYTSATIFAPILADNWTWNAGYTMYTFNLRSNAWFMDGHPFNSSVVWFNIYRTILMQQIGAFYFTSTLYNGTTAFSTGYALPDGVTDALRAGGFSISSTNATLAAQQSASDLAQVLSNFKASNSTIQTIMAYPNQAIVVKANYQVVFNLLNPYRFFQQVMAVPGAGMVDPSFVDENGGVQPNAQNTYVNTHTMSTAPYYVKNYVASEYITMQANPNYWAAKLPASQTNIMLTPPHISTIIVQYVTQSSSIVQGIESNQAQVTEGPPIPALAPSFLQSLSQYPGIKVESLPNAPTFNFLMITLDTQKYPYNMTDFRVALAEAINYSEIFSSVSLQYGKQYVGPISPGLSYYNPNNLSPYAYDPDSSIKLLKALGFTLNLPNGTTVNPGGKQFSPTLSYITSDTAEVKIAQLVQSFLANIGLTATLSGLTTQGETTELSQSATASTYPEMLIWYWYPSWLDPVYQDLVVQVNSTYCGISGNLACFSNSTVDALTANLPFETDEAKYNSTVSSVYQMVYQQVPDIWLYAVIPNWAQRDYVAGIFYNPGILGTYYPLVYYTSS
ncbi:MAG TPA: ABC transporter substrate-binding protein [Nitrososphaerales archaeon]|nr:ABC transporter substrate-binding protein [Nitrososphaerales archaeon]